MKYLIAPSLLSADFAQLGADASLVLSSGADMLHLDVMDNHYVPNLTVGPLVCQALRRYGITAPIDVHLMTTDVDKLSIEFAKAGASNITFHPAVSPNVAQSLKLIQQQGCKAGLAINPADDLSCVNDLWEHIDLLLLMSVNPGFGGQQFIPATLQKLAAARMKINALERNVILAIDGGIKVDNIKAAASAGAEMFIAGSAIFGQKDYAKSISEMRQQLHF